MLCKHHFSKNGQVFFHIFWVVTLIMQSRYQMVAVKLKNSISRYVALHQLDAPDALNKLYMKIGPMDDRDWGLTQIFR